MYWCARVVVGTIAGILPFVCYASVASAQSLAAGWSNLDIGTPAVTGSAALDAGVLTVIAAGTDIWDTSDQFHFVYQPITGDMDIFARVLSLTNTDEWAKTGVMVREALTAESRHAMVAITPSHGYAFQFRPETAGYSVHTPGGAGTAGWVRLSRKGDLFEAYRSDDGNEWIKIGSDTIPMAATVYVGLALTSHNPFVAAIAVIDRVTVSGGTPGNQPPSVSITNPMSGSSASAPASITLSADASDPEGRLASVDFYVDHTFIARELMAPYTIPWVASAAGRYTITAVAHDEDGGTTTSSAVTVTVTGAGEAAPVVTLISPTSGATFVAPAMILLTALAFDVDGEIGRVEFFADGSHIATELMAPYTLEWRGVPPGTYIVTAVAYDATGASARSAAATVTVTSSVTELASALSTPPRIVLFTASADHWTDVTGYLLEVFAANSAMTTDRPVATSDLGKPTIDDNGEIAVDRAMFFSSLPAGHYIATVSAVGPGGQTRSAAVAFSR